MAGRMGFGDMESRLAAILDRNGFKRVRHRRSGMAEVATYESPAFRVELVLDRNYFDVLVGPAFAPDKWFSLDYVRGWTAGTAKALLSADPGPADSERDTLDCIRFLEDRFSDIAGWLSPDGFDAFKHDFYEALGRPDV